MRATEKIIFEISNLIAEGCQVVLIFFIIPSDLILNLFPPMVNRLHVNNSIKSLLSFLDSNLYYQL